MWSTRLFWKLFGAHVGLSVASAVAFVGIISGRHEVQVREQIERRLRDAAIVLRSHFADRMPSRVGEPAVQRRLGTIARETGARITLVDTRGIVLADSEQDPSSMENHRNRPELVQAASGLMGISQRVSPTLKISMLYLALPVTSDKRITGLIRVSLPMDSVLDQINASRRLAWATAVGVIGVALVLTYGFVSNIIRPIRALTQAAEAIAQGDYSVRAFSPRRDEFGKLAAAFQRMNVELSRTLAKINSQQQELAAILGSMVEGVLAIDGDQRVLFVNQAAKEMLAIDSPAVEGRPLGEVVRLPSVEEAVQDAQRGNLLPRR
ncbi:MAG: cell wall metabolism sensor histidine kinase WalK, partial [Planctomycetales bacterium]